MQDIAEPNLFFNEKAVEPLEEPVYGTLGKTSRQIVKDAMYDYHINKMDQTYSDFLEFLTSETDQRYNLPHWIVSLMIDSTEESAFAELGSIMYTALPPGRHSVDRYMSDIKDISCGEISRANKEAFRYLRSIGRSEKASFG